MSQFRLRPIKMILPVFLTDEEMPETHQTVIVAGGIACYNGSNWISQVAGSGARPIEWAVKWWAPLLTSIELPQVWEGHK